MQPRLNFPCISLLLYCKRSVHGIQCTIIRGYPKPIPSQRRYHDMLPGKGDHKSLDQTVLFTGTVLMKTTIIDKATEFCLNSPPGKKSTCFFCFVIIINLILRFVRCCFGYISLSCLVTDYTRNGSS